MVKVQLKTRQDAVEGFFLLTFNDGFVGLPDYVCLIKQEQLRDLKVAKVKFRVLEEAEKYAKR